MSLLRTDQLLDNSFHHQQALASMQTSQGGSHWPLMVLLLPATAYFTEEVLTQSPQYHSLFLATRPKQNQPISSGVHRMEDLLQPAASPQQANAFQGQCLHVNDMLSRCGDKAQKNVSRCFLARGILKSKMTGRNIEITEKPRTYIFSPKAIAIFDHGNASKQKDIFSRHALNCSASFHGTLPFQRPLLATVRHMKTSLSRHLTSTKTGK